jgi:Cu-Zn family superoxide dismutase
VERSFPQSALIVTLSSNPAAAPPDEQRLNPFKRESTAVTVALTTVGCRMVAVLHLSVPEEVNMKLLITALCMVAALSISGHSQSPTGTTGVSRLLAGAALVDGEGRRLGEARLEQAPHGVLLDVELKNATPGIHGLHIHSVGKCDRPTFETAGGHFNPTNRQHGFMNPQGPHAGDLPNIEVPSTTQLSVQFFLRDVTLTPGPASLLDSDGSALVMHAGKDDHVTEPSGDSRERLACGVIARSAGAASGE